MRRAPIVLASTVAGTAAVLTFNARKPEVPTLAAAAETTTAESSGSSGSSGATGSSGSGSGSGSSGSSSSGSSAASDPLAGTHTATGDAVNTVYGAAQVQVTVQDGKITKVAAVQLQDAEPKSVEISSYSAPYLAQSALDKQSGAIDAVSGATYTSGSYAASLQSALDKIGFKAADGSRGSTDTAALMQGGEGHGGPDGGFR